MQFLIIRTTDTKKLPTVVREIPLNSVGTTIEPVPWEYAVEKCRLINRTEEPSIIRPYAAKGSRTTSITGARRRSWRIKVISGLIRPQLRGVGSRTRFLLLGDELKTISVTAWKLDRYLSKKKDCTNDFFPLCNFKCFQKVFYTSLEADVYLWISYLHFYCRECDMITNL